MGVLTRDSLITLDPVINSSHGQPSIGLKKPNLKGTVAPRRQRGHHTCKPHGHLADGALRTLKEGHTLLQEPELLALFLLQLEEAALDNTAAHSFASQAKQDGR